MGCFECYKCQKTQEEYLKNAHAMTLSELHESIPDKMHQVVYIIGDDNLPISTQYGDVMYYLTQGIPMKVYETFEKCMDECKKVNVN